MPAGSDQSGGINNSGTIVAKNVAGRDINNYGPSAEDVVDALERRGVLQTAEKGGLQRRVVVMLAQRLKPAERLDFDQAITELEHAVEIARHDPQNRCVNPARIVRRMPNCGAPTPTPVPLRI